MYSNNSSQSNNPIVNQSAKSPKKTWQKPDFILLDSSAVELPKASSYPVENVTILNNQSYQS